LETRFKNVKPQNRNWGIGEEPHRVVEAVFSARAEAKKFTTQIDVIDTELRLYDAEYEQAEMLVNQLQLSVQTCMLKLQQYMSQLRMAGFEKPLETTPKQVEEAETTVKMMRFELERIGAVNQLALSHYAEQISRYRELSLRLNELERRNRQSSNLWMKSRLRNAEFSWRL